MPGWPRIIAILAIVVIPLIGCGKKGPLYLPDKPPPAAPAS